MWAIQTLYLHKLKSLKVKTNLTRSIILWSDKPPQSGISLSIYNWSEVSRLFSDRREIRGLVVTLTPGCEISHVNE